MALPLKRQHVYSIEVAIACAATSRSIVAWPDDNYTHAEARCARKNLTQWTPDQRLEAHGCVSKDSDLRTMTQFPEQSITLESFHNAKRMLQIFFSLPSWLHCRKMGEAVGSSSLCAGSSGGFKVPASLTPHRRRPRHTALTFCMFCVCRWGWVVLHNAEKFEVNMREDESWL